MNCIISDILWCSCANWASIAVSQQSVTVACCFVHALNWSLKSGFIFQTKMKTKKAQIPDRRYVSSYVYPVLAIHCH